MPPTSGTSVDLLGDQNFGGRQYICPINQFMMACNPDHLPRSEEALLQIVRARAPTRDLETAWKLYITEANQFVDQLKSKPAVAVRGIIPK